MSELTSLVQAAIVFGTVILFGATGEILTEKSGNLNLGVPGIMYLGGIAGLIGAFFYESAVAEPSGIVSLLIALLCCLAASAFGGLIYSILTITLRANQNVTGLTLTIFGSGFANFFGGSLNKLAGGVGQISVAKASAAFRATIPGLAGLGTLGDLLFSFGCLTYVAIVIAILVNYFLNRTRSGLNLRAVGENPATADAAGSTSRNTNIWPPARGRPFRGSAAFTMSWTIYGAPGPTTGPSRDLAGWPWPLSSSRPGEA